MKRKEILVDQGLMYALTEDAAGLYLEVTCGGIAMETVVLKLKKEEINEFRKQGKSVLDDLAYAVTKGQDDFADRILK